MKFETGALHIDDLIDSIKANMGQLRDEGIIYFGREIDTEGRTQFENDCASAIGKVRRGTMNFLGLDEAEIEALQALENEQQ